jgi:hypothetical protein
VVFSCGRFLRTTLKVHYARHVPLLRDPADVYRTGP